MKPWYEIEGEDSVPSPALLLYADRIESNLELMLKVAGGPQRLRPHVKTHKLAPLVRRQLELGITKFKCSTIAEAEMCATEGAKDVLLAMPCAGSANAARLASLAKCFSGSVFSTIVDSENTVEFLAEAATLKGVRLGAFIDIDCGMGRTGIKPGTEALRLAKAIGDTPGLRFEGVHAYDGHIHESDLASREEKCAAAFEGVEVFVRELEASGITVKEFLCGGSPTFGIHARFSDRTLSPGTTVLWDFGYADKFSGDLPFLPAAVLLTRVLSKPSSSRITVDLGHKSVAAENPHPRVRFEEFAGDVPVVMQSEEHLVLEGVQSDQFQIGQALHGVPRHVCPTIALHAEALVIRGGRVAEVWPITARDRKITF